MEYLTRNERALTDVVPAVPAAVRVYGSDGACAALCLDLDTSHGGPEAVADDERRLVRWLAECGARVITDESPSGGRHVYVPLADRLGHADARELVEAIAKLFPTVDPSPHRSLRTGCIRVPGARHVSGGHQRLTMSINTAYDVLRRPNASDVVVALRTRLQQQIKAWRAAQTPTAVPYLPPPARVDGAEPGRRNLSGRVLAIACDGDATGYRSGSEARFAVMCAAVAAGWSFADVASRIDTGRWPGMASFYARYRPGSRHREITGDWNKALTWVAAQPGKPTKPQISAPGTTGDHTVRRSNTSVHKPQGGRLHEVTSTRDFGEDEHAFVRIWRAALRTSEVHRMPGRRWYTVRFVLRALGEAAHKTGTRVVAFGVRSLAIAAGTDHTTAAAALHAAASLGWCDRLEEGRGVEADTWVLTLPEDLRDRAGGLRWDKGKAHSLRPAFRELGHVAAFVFETVEAGNAATITEIVTMTGISRSAVHDAVAMLHAWNLLERRDGRLVAHPERLLAVAEHLGALESVTAQIQRYRAHRAAWIAHLEARAPREPEHADPDYWEPPEDEPDETWWWPPDDHAPAWTLLDIAQTAHRQAHA